jgi:hypothetical protein
VKSLRGLKGRVDSFGAETSYAYDDDGEIGLDAFTPLTRYCNRSPVSLSK